MSFECIDGCCAEWLGVVNWIGLFRVLIVSSATVASRHSRAYDAHNADDSLLEEATARRQETRHHCDAVLCVRHDVESNSIMGKQEVVCLVDFVVVA